MPVPAKSFLSFILSILAVLFLVGCGAGSDERTDADATTQTPEENTEAMAREHADDTPSPSEAVMPEPTVPVVARKAPYSSLDAEYTGYYAEPAQGADDLPGLIVIHEWWGLNENIETMARRLAGEGYRVLAVDLYDGKVGSTPEEARALATAARENEDALAANLRAAYTWLEGIGAPKIGSIGWCFGGGYSLVTALLYPEELDAAVIYYGRLVTDEEELAPLQVPILGLFGAEDDGIPLDMVRAFEEKLTQMGKTHEIHVYEGADHAFANPSGTRYDAEAAEKAWAETTSFLAEHLAPDA